jgi:hypothetical protein
MNLRNKTADFNLYNGFRAQNKSDSDNIIQYTENHYNSGQSIQNGGGISSSSGLVMNSGINLSDASNYVQNLLAVSSFEFF